MINGFGFSTLKEAGQAATAASEKLSGALANRCVLMECPDGTYGFTFLWTQDWKRGVAKWIWFVSSELKIQVEEIQHDRTAMA